MRAFGKLLRKECKQNGPTALAFAAAMVAWFVFLYNFSGRWPDRLIVPLLILPMGFIPFWALWRVIQSFRSEWSGRHVHLLLMLPMPGWTLIISKFLVLLLEVSLYGLVQAGGFYLVAIHRGILFIANPFVLQALQASVLRTALLAPPYLVLIFAALYAGVQFAWLVSRLLPVGRWAAAVLASAGIGWLILRGSWLAGLVLGWLPRVPIGQYLEIVDVTGDGIPELVTHVAAVQSGPLVGCLLLVVGLFAATSWVLEREIEI